MSDHGERVTREISPGKASRTARIHFQYDPKLDIVIATPHWTLATPADVDEWYREYEEFFSRFRRKLDCILVLDHFDVRAAVGSHFGEMRAKIHKNFTRFSFRVHSSNRVKLFTNTSGVRYNVSTSEAATVEDAIEGILELRRATANES